MNAPDREAMVGALCAILKAAVPQAELTTKWNAPNFVIDGRDLITLNLPPKGGVRVVFHRGATAKDTKTGQRLIEAPAGLVVWATDQRCSAAFTSLEDIEAKNQALADFAKAWVAAA